MIVYWIYCSSSNMKERNAIEFYFGPSINNVFDSTVSHTPELWGTYSPCYARYWYISCTNRSYFTHEEQDGFCCSVFLLQLLCYTCHSVLDDHSIKGRFLKGCRGLQKEGWYSKNHLLEWRYCQPTQEMFWIHHNALCVSAASGDMHCITLHALQSSFIPKE